MQLQQGGHLRRQFLFHERCGLIESESEFENYFTDLDYRNDEKQEEGRQVLPEVPNLLTSLKFAPSSRSLSWTNTP